MPRPAADAEEETEFIDTDEAEEDEEDLAGLFNVLRDGEANVGSEAMSFL